MSDRPTCPNCGAELSPSAPRGLCLSCLSRAGLEGDSGSPATIGAPSATIALTVGGVLDTLAQRIGPVPHVMLYDTTTGEEPGPIVRTDFASTDASIRYRIDGEIARGGMGAVLKGHDPDLGREVALKVLREDFRDDADMIRRFVEEAQIGGQLQHPGIVPIYELGTFRDRRPFFAMKLVKGHTLASLLAERGDPTNARPRFLAIFESIAQTVAYAHSRGVIHRDLKPSNVMVGSFGEVQVMDWGLAKALPRGGMVDDAQAGRTRERESVIASSRSGSDSDLSRAGSVLGTPSYMAPEQARGEVEALDERVDVFALGSILCEILTGAPAFAGRNSAEIVRKAAQGDTANAVARLESCGADTELVALAKECLAAEAEDRPHDAGAVAGRITTHLAGVQNRLHAAEVARAAEAARAEEAAHTAEEAVERARAERRARRLQVGLAGSLLILTTIGGLGFTYLLLERQARRAQLDALFSRAAAALDRAERGVGPAAEAAREEAKVVIGRAEQVAGPRADDATRARLRDLVGRVALDDRLRDLIARLEEARASFGDNFENRRVDAEYASAFRDFGLNPDVVEPTRFAATFAGRPVAGEVAAALDNWSRFRGWSDIARAPDAWDRIAATARALDPDPWRDALRATRARPRAEAVPRLRELASDRAVLDRQPAVSLDSLATALRDAGEPKLAATVLRPAWRRFPGDFWVNYNLAFSSVSDDDPRAPAAESYLMAAVAIRPRSAVAHYYLGLRWKERGDLEGAADEFREAARLDAERGHVGSAIGALRDLGRPDESAAIYRRALERAPTNARAHAGLAIALNAQGKHDEARAAIREAIRWAGQDAQAHRELGGALKNQGKFDEAIAEYREVIRLQPDDSVAHRDLGMALREQGTFEEAIAEYRQAIRLKPDDAFARMNLGYALGAIGRWREARDELGRSIERDPANHFAWFLAATFDLWDGDALSYRRRCLAMLDRFEGTTDMIIAERVSKACLLDPRPHDGWARAGRLAERVPAEKTSAGLQAWFNAARALAAYRAGRPAEAFERSRPVPGASLHAAIISELLLALGSHGDGRPTEARLWLDLARRTVTALTPPPDGPPVSNGLQDLLHIHLLLREAEARIRGGTENPDGTPPPGEIRLRAELARAQCDLGHQLRNQGDYAGALTMLRRGHELGSGQPGWSYPSAQWVAEAERQAELAGRLPAILKGEDHPKDSAERLALGRMCHDTKRFAAAAQFWAEVMELDPKLADDRRTQYRYSAACAAALAAAGQGKDDPPPGDDAKARLRGLALDWLKAELAAWTKVLDQGDSQGRPFVQQVLRHWKVDSDLVGLRDTEALARLPETEAGRCRALWAEVESLLKRAEGMSP